MVNILVFVYNFALYFTQICQKGVILFKSLYHPFRFINIFKQYSMHIFGLVAFLSTFSLGIMALIKKTNSDTENLAIFIPYGILLFFLNIFYIKAIRVSRENYENKLKKEKEYSQEILKSQKLFLRYAVHETNTPLAVIMANIELYELEFGKNTLISNIEAATKNMYGIYDDLSYLAKKDKLAHNKQKIILTDFVKGRIDFFDIVARQSKLSFEFQSNCSQSIVLLNESKLQRIIDNNITNALKYTQEHEIIKISIYTHNSYCIFEILSHSTIIKEPKRVFDAYYRESSIKEGLGLGLKLVKSICDEENIKIELQSNEENTSFKYYFNKEIQ